MGKTAKETRTDDSCAAKASQQREMNRRQFATNAGVLMGVLAGAKPARGQAPVVAAGKSADDQRAGWYASRPRLMARGIRHWNSCANGTRNGQRPAQR